MPNAVTKDVDKLKVCLKQYFVDLSIRTIPKFRLSKLSENFVSRGYGLYK